MTLAPGNAGRLSGRVILVTGGAGGIGLAFCRRAAEEGAAVIAADAAPADDRVARFLADHPGARYERLDVTDPAAVEACVAAALAEHGRIDVLVVTAALFADLTRYPVHELPLVEWDRVLAVNLTGAFLAVRAVVPSMRAREAGSIVLFTSNTVAKGLPNFLHYVTTKGGIIAMTRSLARELGPSGITVNAVSPGYILHERTEPTDGGRNERAIAGRAIRRTLVPEDVLGTMVFLASGDSAAMTGQVLTVDGGEVFT